MPLREGLHYNPGHYLLIYGDQTVASLGALIRGTGPNNIPNIRGIQKRYIWRQLQPVAFGPLNGPQVDDLIADLTTCKNLNMRLRMLLMIKALRGGKAVPDNLRTAANEGGVWNWPVGSTTNEHPKLYVDNVKNALVDFVTKLCQFVDSYGKPVSDPRHWLEDIAFNESSWGNGWWAPYGWTTSPYPTNDLTQNLRKVGLAFRAAQSAMVANLKGHFVTHFVNFPNNASFSILSDPVAGLPAHMRAIGVAMGGPDSWMDDADAERGSFLYYPMADGITPVCVSVQNANYQHYNHDDQSGKENGGVPIYRHDITIDMLYKHSTTAGVMFRGLFRNGLRATHVVWSAMDAAIPGSDPPIKPFTNLRTYMRNKWNAEGTPDYHNVAPGVITTIPALFEAGDIVVPTAVVPSLAVDTGIVTNDKITNNPAINLAGMVSGATRQWALADTGPWTDGNYTPSQGLNKVYFRQRVGALPGPVSDPFEFTFVNQPPQIIRASGSGNYIFLTCARTGLDLSNAWKADKSFFKVKRPGQPDAVPIGIYVSEGLKYCRLELNPNVALLAGQSVTLDYTPTGTDNTKFFQDIAGNVVPAFAGKVINNTTGMSAPTKTCTITKVNNNTVSGGYSNQPDVTIYGSVSAPLEAWEEIEVRRNAGQVGFTEPVTGQTTFTINDPILQETGLRNYSARVINGQLLGPLSPQFAITFDTKFPSIPTIFAADAFEGQDVIITGLWGAGTGEQLYVTVGGTEYSLTSTPRAITLNPTNDKQWTLNVGPLPLGLYPLHARVVDPAGNVSETDSDEAVTVASMPSINNLILAVCDRRPMADDFEAAASGEEE